MRILFLAVMLFPLPWIVAGQSGNQENKSAIRLRRPIALVLLDGGKYLAVANRDSGTIAVLATNTRRKTTEVHVGRKLSDMIATPKGELILVTDEQAGEVVVLKQGKGL